MKMQWRACVGRETTSWFDSKSECKAWFVLIGQSMPKFNLRAGRSVRFFHSFDRYLENMRDETFNNVFLDRRHWKGGGVCL